MDINLLAKMVKEVVMDHNSVTLPGLGSFVAELVPAAFADRGYTILPPYRRLYFSPRQGSDTLLADFYRKANPELSEADATRILTDFLSELKEVLKQRKTVLLPGLGRLRATRENHFFFVANEDLDIWPAGFGLAPISLKTHEETPEEVAGAVAALANILEQEQMPDQVGHDEAPAATVEDPSSPSAPQDDNGAEEAPVKPAAEAPATAAEAPDKPAAEAPDKPAEEAPVKPAAEAPVIPGEAEESPEAGGVSRLLWRVLLIIGIVVVAAVLLLAILGRVAPAWMDTFLYSPEQLDILRSTY